MLGLQQGVVKLVSYCPEWKELFAQEESSLRSAIGDYIVDIQHVGSTAIPGLVAKPIIDIAVAVEKLEDVEKCIEPLVRMGYEYKGDRDNCGHFFFAKGDSSRRTYYLHMSELNSIHWKNQLLFRDYLLKYKETAEAYAKLKKKLAQKFQGNREFYTPGKSEFIESILRKAECEIATNPSE